MPEIVVPTDEQAYTQPRWTDVQKQMPKDTNNVCIILNSVSNWIQKAILRENI